MLRKEPVCGRPRPNQSLPKVFSDQAMTTNGPDTIKGGKSHKIEMSLWAR